MSNLEKLIERVTKFRDARDWKQFHNPKDSAIALTSEAVEVLEHFLWKSPQEVEKHVKTHKGDISDELADVLYWIFLMAHDLGVDIPEAFERKMQENEKKYPVEKAKGKNKKY